MSAGVLDAIVSATRRRVREGAYSPAPKAGP